METPMTNTQTSPVHKNKLLLKPTTTSPPKSPPLQGPTSTYAGATRINVADLLHLVPQLVTRIDNLEKELKENKQTTAAVIVKLVKKVKRLETRLRMGSPQTEDGSKRLRDEDADLFSIWGGILRGRRIVFENPKGKDSGEADITAQVVCRCETCTAGWASQKTKTYTRKVKSGLKKKLDVGVSSGDRKSAFEKFKSTREEIEFGFTNISSGEVRVSQRKGKEVLEEQPQPKRSKK
ncbi:hypothetical protein Tco_1392057 [Tanacetum coccineum]